MIGNRHSNLGSMFWSVHMQLGVLAKQFPDAIPELVSYMIAIIRASQDYEGFV